MSTHVPGFRSFLRFFLHHVVLAKLATSSTWVNIPLQAFGMSGLCNAWVQCLSQDLETGCPKLAIVKSLGVQIFKGDHDILRFQTKNMYKFIKIRHDILIHCHVNYMKRNKLYA